MKQKLVSAALAIALLFALSVPARAACPDARQWLAQYGCGTPEDGESDWEELLRQLLGWLGWGAPTEDGEEQPGAEEEAPAEPEQPAAPESTASAYEREVIRLVNAERAKAGVAPLTEDALLTRTARMKSQDMHDRGYFDHNSPTYGSPFQLMRSQGVSYRIAGENIAMGYHTPEAVVAAWMASPGHRANILNASYTKIGVGYVASGGYWTQHFTG